MAVSREKLFSESASLLRDPPTHLQAFSKNRKCWHYHLYPPIPWVLLLLLIQQKLKVRVEKGISFFFFFFLLWCLQSSSYQSITLYFLSISWAECQFSFQILTIHSNCTCVQLCHFSCNKLIQLFQLINEQIIHFKYFSQITCLELYSFGFEDFTRTER